MNGFAIAKSFYLPECHSEGAKRLKNLGIFITALRFFTSFRMTKQAFAISRNLIITYLGYGLITSVNPTI